MDVEPLSLQELTRTIIRSILRRNVEIEFPNLKRSPPSTKRAKKKRKASNRLVSHGIRILHDSSDDDDVPFRIVKDRNRNQDPLSLARSRINRLREIAKQRAGGSEDDYPTYKTDFQLQEEQEEVEDEEGDVDTNCCSETNETQAVIEQEPRGSGDVKVGNDFI